MEEEEEEDEEDEDEEEEEMEEAGNWLIDHLCDQNKKHLSSKDLNNSSISHFARIEYHYEYVWK